MKRFVLLALPLWLATAHVAPAEDNADHQKQARHNAGVARSRGHGPQGARMAPQGQAQRNFSSVQRQQGVRSGQNFARSAYNSDVSVQPRRQPRIYNPQVAPVQQPTAAAPLIAAEQPQLSATAETRSQFGRGASRRGGDWNRGGNWSSGNGDAGQAWRDRRDGTTATDSAGNRTSGEQSGEWRNRRGERGGNWSGARHNGNWDRNHHQRNWWLSRYTRFALFGGGYYYWNSGYWYPAYGYDPYFSTYSYDAPIYAYNDQDPGQVIANVQQELQQRGYYRGDLDGTFGPITRSALLNYQQDTGLPVTGQIDEDTLGSLGLQ